MRMRTSKLKVNARSKRAAAMRGRLIFLCFSEGLFRECGPVKR